jgi:hypothetical protein
MYPVLDAPVSAFPSSSTTPSKKVETDDDRAPMLAAAAAVVAPPPSIAPEPFLWVSLNRSDRLRVGGDARGIEEVKEAVRHAITVSWPKGLKTEHDYAGSWEYYLNGYPWLSTGEGAVQSRRIIGGVLQAFSGLGWEIICETDLSRKLSDAATLYFRRVSNRHPSAFPRVHAIWAVSLNRSDRLRLIDAPEGVRDMVRSLIFARYPDGIRGEQEYAGAYEFTLNGLPWARMEQGKRAAAARWLMQGLMDGLRSQGHTLYVTADVSKKVEGNDDQQWKVDMTTFYYVPPTGAYLPPTAPSMEGLRLEAAGMTLENAAASTHGTPAATGVPPPAEVPAYAVPAQKTV